MEILTHIFIIFSTLFIMWLCVRWDSKEITDSLVKALLLLMGLLGLIIELKKFGIL